MGRFWLQNIILAPSNSKAVWNTQYSEVELQLVPFENITFLGPDPLSVVRYAKKKRVQVHANKETVTKITRQRRMKRQCQWQWAVGSGQWEVGSGTPHENETVERGGNCWKSLYKEAQYLSGIT